MSGQSPSQPFAGLGNSLVLPGKGSRHQEYPTRADYLACLAREGLARDAAELAANPELVAQVHAHWHALGQQGCRFAVFLSGRPVEHGWGRMVVPEGDPARWDDGLWREISDGVDLAIREPAAQALSLIFPAVATPEELVALLEGLEGRLGWRCERLPEPDGGWGGPEPLVGLGFRVPLNAAVLSWPLGLGPFDFLPVTRQAPLTEVILVTKPKRLPPRSTRISDKPGDAHLADMPVNVEDVVFEGLWTATERHKRFVLGTGADLRAKARVSFAVPARLWRG